MRQNFLPFSKPSLGDNEINAMAEVIRSGWITTGRQAADFEKEFAGYCRAASAVALTSATAGMHLLLVALGIGPGDEVITPSMTWVSTVNLICLCGAKPVFCDVDRHTLMTSAAHIAPLITERTKLIVPVHFAGAALDLDPIRTLAADHGIALAEDAAHAVGTEYKGERIGCRGTAIFSFHPVKNMTCGEGGMIVSDAVDFTEKIRRLKFHGLGVDAYDRATQGRTPQAEVIEPGYKYNLTDIAAALGRVQLGRLNDFISRRTMLAEHYSEQLEDIEEIIPLNLPEYNQHTSRHLFIIRLDIEKAGMDRDQFMAGLKEKNIGTGLHFRAVHQQKYYRNLPRAGADLPETEWNSARICSLPLFPAMTEDDVDDVISAIKEVLAR